MTFLLSHKLPRSFCATDWILDDDNLLTRSRIDCRIDDGSLSNHVQRFHVSFSYQAKSWIESRRVVVKVEWHPGELYPRVGFIVTNMTRPAERVVAFYNKRGTAEQWIKEGKNAIKWTRLSCCSFAANAVRLQLHALAYNLANFMRTLALPEAVKQWSLTSLREEKPHQDRREGCELWPLRHLPDGRGRGAEGIVPGHSTAHCGTAPTAGCDAGVRRLTVPCSKANDRGPAPRWRKKLRFAGPIVANPPHPREIVVLCPNLYPCSALSFQPGRFILTDTRGTCDVEDVR